MSVDEFFDLVCGCDVIDDNFGQREIAQLFNLSMMTQKNELESDRHFNMIFVEFIEATGRVAGKTKISPMFTEEETGVSESQSRLRNAGREDHPLHKKIEALIFRMIKSVLPIDFFEQTERIVAKFYKEQRNAPKKTKFVAEGGPYASKHDKDDIKKAKAKQ